MNEEKKLLFDDTLDWLDQRAAEFQDDRAELGEWLAGMDQFRQQLASLPPTSEKKRRAAATCAQCRQVVTEQAKFCNHCGAKRCEHCLEFAPRGKYCNQCGGEQ